MMYDLDIAYQSNRMVGALLSLAPVMSKLGLPHVKWMVIHRSRSAEVMSAVQLSLTHDIEFVYSSTLARHVESYLKESRDEHD